MNRISQIVFAFLLIIFTIIPCVFSASDISVKAEVDRAFITIGDEINFKITVRHDSKSKILEMDASDALSDFTIKKTSHFSFEDAGFTNEGKNYVITNYELGDYVIKPIKIQYKEQSGPVKSISSNQLYISVGSVDKNKDPNSDIKGPKGVISLKSPILPWILLIIALLALGSFFVWKFYYKANKSNLEALESPLTPHDEAYKALNELEYSDLLKQGNVKLYFFRMSEILRRFLERRFQIRALESTTGEVTNALKPLITMDNMTLIREVLSFCDLAKFAKYTPSPSEILEQNKQAKLVVDRTKEIIEEQPVEQTQTPQTSK